MENKAISRKDFILLTFTLIGSTAVVGSSCDDDDNTTGAGGAGGTGTGRAGSSGTGVAGRGGTTGNAGAGGTTGQAGSGGSGGGLTSCPGSQLPDNIGHTHTLSVPVSAAGATATMTFDTGVTLAHLHMVTLTGAQLATIASRGSVTVTSSIADGHQHMYSVTCQ